MWMAAMQIAYAPRGAMTRDVRADVPETSDESLVASIAEGDRLAVHSLASTTLKRIAGARNRRE
jgi:hypothetical protein